MSTTEIPEDKPSGPLLGLGLGEGLGPLVERLRNGAAPLDDPNLNDEAAAEIERLHAELMAAQESAKRSEPFLGWHQMLRHCGHGEHPPLTVWEAEQLARAWLERERLRLERDHARAQVENAVKLLTGIHNLLYPAPVTTPDGRTMVFRPGNPHEFMQALSDRIRALPDEMVARGVLGDA